MINRMMFALMLAAAFIVTSASPSYAQIKLDESVAAQCAQACTEKVREQLAKNGCVTKENFETCLAEDEICKKLDEEVRSIVWGMCTLYNDSPRCGAGTALRATAPPKPTSKEGWDDIEILPPTKEEACKDELGVIVTITEERIVEKDGKRVLQRRTEEKCMTVRDLHDRLKKLEDWVNGTKLLSEEDVRRLIEEMQGVDTDNGAGTNFDLRIKTLEQSLTNLCRPDSNDPGALPLACTKLRDQVDQNTQDIAELKPQVEANTRAIDASGLDGNDSLFFLGANAGVHFVQTLMFREVVGFGGVKVRWMPRLTPGLRLDLEFAVNGSSEVADANRVMAAAALGLLAPVHEQVLLGGRIGGEHFFLADERSVLNTYGIGPTLLWVPNLDRKRAGGVLPAFGADLLFGADRMLMDDGGVETQFQAVGTVNIGLVF